MFYSKEITAYDYDCDSGNRLKISSIMKYMQQVSGEQLVKIGLPYEKLFEENMVFLMSKSCIKIIARPLAGQRIIVGTAPVATKGARFIREFIIDDEFGHRMVSCITLWLLIDPSSRRILRPAHFPYPIPFAESIVGNDISDLDLPKPELDMPIKHNEITVRYSMIDCNNHVNNSVYADFVCDALPYDKVAGGNISTIVLGFHNEAKLGDVIRIGVCDDNGRYIIGGRKADGSSCFDALVN